MKTQEENILVIQLSDLHFDAEGRAEHITHASAIVKAALSEAPNHRNILFLVSGDVIDRSEVSGFDWATEFCKDLEQQVEKYGSDRKVLGFVLTPGNHDTVRPEDAESRLQIERALNSLRDGHSVGDTSKLDVTTLVRRQEHFFAFAQRVTRSIDQDGVERFYHTRDFPIGKSGVRFHIINSSWSC